VELETAKTDEDGKAVHEDCYVQRMMRLKEITPRLKLRNAPGETFAKGIEDVGSLITASLFSAESLQQHPQLLEAQFEFLGHLRPRGFRNVGKVEPYVFVLKICECPLDGGKHPPRVSLFQRQVSHDFEGSFESSSVIAIRLNQAIEVGLNVLRSCEFVRQRVYLDVSQ
jgi:hypothetical protein